METVTVDEALAKGRRMISYPVLAIMISAPIVLSCATTLQYMPVWIIPAGWFAGLAGAWLYWSFNITKWRLWAFENVRNVHQLKKQAIQERLIWPEGHFFEKTEIRSAADKEKWAELQIKFSRQDVFNDDLSIGNETVVYYSRPIAFIFMAFMLLFVAAGIFLLTVKTHNHLLAYALIILGGIMAISKFLQATRKQPQIILNEKGIQTVSTPFYEWKDISNEEAIRERVGKNTRSYLVYNYPNGKVKLSIGLYAINRKNLEKLLILYRGRYNKKQSSSMVLM